MQNAKNLVALAGFRSLAISAAYLTPFFLQNGLSLTQIFILQSIYSVASLAWEIPSGYIADRIGRALCIKLSVPIFALGIIAYAFSHSFWLFVIWELVLALANGLFSEVDTALLYDSLKAENKGDEYVKTNFAKFTQRSDAIGYLSTALGVPVDFVIVAHADVLWTLVTDGLTGLIGIWFAWQLTEAPRQTMFPDAPHVPLGRALLELAQNKEARWLATLGSILNCATFVAFWLAAPYYASLGIGAVWFSVLLAARSFWKAALSHLFHRQKRLQLLMGSYVLLAAGVCFALATGQLWLIWALLGHDVVQSLHAQPIKRLLNAHIDDRHRATLNSAISFVRRLSFVIIGPLVGWLIDATNLSMGFVAVGSITAVFGLVAYLRLVRLGTFRR